MSLNGSNETFDKDRSSLNHDSEVLASPFKKLNSGSKDSASLLAKLQRTPSLTDQQMEDLPDELWLRIFSYLEDSEKCTMALVSRKFCALATDPSLWTVLDLRSCNLMEVGVMESVMLHIERSGSLMKKLYFQNTLRSAHLMSTVLENCPQLKFLEIRGADTFTFSEFETLTKTCRQLEHLDLSVTGVFNRERNRHELAGSTECTCTPDNSFTSHLKNLVNLRTLNLYACRDLHSEGIKLIGDNCPCLEDLDIDAVNYLSDASLVYMVGKLKNSLRKFSFDGETVTDETYIALGELSKLTYLSISFAEMMTRQGLLGIATLSRLKFLKIRRGVNLVPRDFVDAFASRRLALLEALNLSECAQLDDEALIIISENCPLLLELKLSWCWELTDVSLVEVAKNCRLLKLMGLCGVSKLTGEFLNGIETFLPALRFVDLEKCPEIDKGFLYSICEKYDFTITIHDYYGTNVVTDELTPFSDSYELSFHESSD